MLSDFPALLYPFLAPTVLRTAVALVLFYLAYKQFARRQEIAVLRPQMGKLFTWLAVFFNVVLGSMLLFGYHTQVAAMLASLGQLYGLWANKRWPSVVILSNAAVVLTIVILISLIISGPGAFARDLPL